MPLLPSRISSVVPTELGSNEARHTPFGIVDAKAKSKQGLAFRFLFVVGRNAALSDTIELLAIVGLGDRFQVNMKLSFGVATNVSREKLTAILEDLANVVWLSRRSKMPERIRYLARVIDFVDILNIVTRTLVEKPFSYLDSYRVVSK
jgi:hypothetical protein